MIKNLIDFFIKFSLILFFYKKINKKLILNKIKLIKNGKYITNLSNCISCHTQNGSKPFSGGVPIKTNFGIIFTPNITFSKTGIYKWKYKDFLKAIKLGLNKTNNFLYPIFPYINFSKIKNYDVKSIYYYLKTIPKENIINIKNKLKIPFNFRKLLLGWRTLFFKKEKINFNKLKSSLKRGKYIVESLGHCNICHTNMNFLGKNIKKLNYCGNLINKENWFVPSLVNNYFKKKNIQEIFNILKYGFSKNSKIYGPMSEVINNSLQYVNSIDIKSISNYLKILFNKNNIYKKNIKILEINKLYSKFFYEKGKLIFNNNCYNCHGKLIIGKYPLYPNIKFLYNKFLNNIPNIIFFYKNNNNYKKFYTSIMPNFINKISFKDCYYLINYINFIKKLKKD